MNMSCVSDPNFIVTAIAVMILLLVPMALPILKSIPGFSTSKTSSIIAGMSLSAIFVFMLPDIIGKIPQIAAHTKISFIKNESHLQFLVFAVMLFAFCTMYTIEKLSLDRTKNQLESSYSTFWLHMTIICILLICLVSSYPPLSRSNFYAIGIIAALSIFGIFLEEIALQKHFNSLYSHAGRYILMLAIVVGWSIGLRFFTQETTLFTVLTESYFVGTIMLSVIKTEFDLISRRNNHITFVSSAIVMTLIIFGLLSIDTQKSNHKAVGKNAKQVQVAAPATPAAPVTPATNAEQPVDGATANADTHQESTDGADTQHTSADDHTADAAPAPASGEQAPAASDQASGDQPAAAPAAAGDQAAGGDQTQ